VGDSGLRHTHLLKLHQELLAKEKGRLAPYACMSDQAVRRKSEERSDYRHAFALDADRILHSKAYTRYIDKTQVFYLVANDHITHRVLHVQLVSRIARTIGRFLGLNEDLIEAVSLAHDIGHPPFGHDGERILDELCRRHGLASFQHNLQSVRFLDRIERQGQGWNLSLQTLDGIMCHDGEIHEQRLVPRGHKTFDDFDREMAEKSRDPKKPLTPMTLEGCVVRMADTIAYIGRDIEDAIELKLIDRSEIPRSCQEVLGRTNGTIVYRLVTDLIANGVKDGGIGLSAEISQALSELKRFNYQRIYLNPAIKWGLDKIRVCYQALFERFLEDLAADRHESPIFSEFLDSLAPETVEGTAHPVLVRDFIAGMTDDYFLRQAARLGCPLPERR